MYEPLTVTATAPDVVRLERGNKGLLLLSLDEAKSLLATKLPKAVADAVAMQTEAGRAARKAALEAELAAIKQQQAAEEHAARRAAQAAGPSEQKP